MKTLETVSKSLPEVKAILDRIHPTLEEHAAAQTLVLTGTSNGGVHHFICRYLPEMPSPELTAKTALIVSQEQVEIRLRLHPALRTAIQ